MKSLKTSTHLDVILTITGILLILTWMRYAQVLIVPFLFSVFITIIISSPLGWLKKRKVPLGIAMPLVLIFVIGLLVLFSIFLGSSIQQFSMNLPTYQNQLQQLMNTVLNWLESYDVHVSRESVMTAVDPGTVMQLLNSLIASLGDVFSKVFLILFTVILMLLEAWDMPQKIKLAYGGRSRSVLEKSGEIIDNVRKYMSIKAVVSLITGVLISIGLAILGLEFAVLWGMLAFFLNFIPNIGAIIAAIPAVLFALLQLGFAKTLIVAGIYLVVNMVIGNFIEPRYIGSKVGLSTLVVFLSLVFWSWVLGPIGMILSVPLTMLIKFILLANKNTKAYAVILGSDVEGKPEGGGAAS